MTHFIGFNPMICPYCLRNEEIAFKTQTKETRHFLDDDDEPYVERRHQCPQCNESFFTIETFNREPEISRDRKQI
jgi:transcriptional regulator NrdR family protein